MSNLVALREKQNLTQEELAEKSGLSVRTIQRIEAGARPKGYTLKSLSEALEIDPSQLLDPAPQKNQYNFSLIKLINISCILFFIPLGNIFIPLVIMRLKKEINPITKQIVSVQILWTITSAVLFFLSPFVQRMLDLSNQLIIVVMISCILVNLFIIIRNTLELDQRKQLYIKLNFSFI